MLGVAKYTCIHVVNVVRYLLCKQGMVYVWKVIFDDFSNIIVLF